MSAMVNPFDQGGFNLADMTRAIQLIPNRYGLLNALGLFPMEPISTRTAMVEMSEGELRLLPQKRLGAPATMGNSDKRTIRSFSVPFIPHNDVVLPSDVMGIRGLGLKDGEDPVATVMARKLLRMRQRHGQTLEYMRVKALSGITKDGEGNTIYDWYKEFDITKKSVDFTLGNEKTDVLEKSREITRHIEDNLKGDSMTSIMAWVSPTFFDKLIKHPTVKEAYKYYQSTNAANPLRDDMRNGFPFGGILYREYMGTVTLANGRTDKLITDGEGIAFPLGTLDTFSTLVAPGDLMECVGTYGEELYAYQVARDDGTGIDIYTQSNPLPIVKRPALCVRLYSSS